MEETVTTTVETVSEQTTPDVVENQTTEVTEMETQPDATQEEPRHECKFDLETDFLHKKSG